MTARELKKLLRKSGWELISQESSHEKWQHPEYGIQIIAVHNEGMEFTKSTWSKIKKRLKL